MSDEDASNFMSAVANMIFVADGAAETKLFEANEAQRLKDDAVRFRQSAATIIFGIEALLKSAPANQDSPSFSDFDSALKQLIISSYRIGAATWIHNGNKRVIRETGTRLGRGAGNEKRAKRDSALDDGFGILISAGYKGSKLQEEVHKLLSAAGITNAKMRKPGLRIVQDWAKNHRLRGSWRPLQTDNAQS